MNRSTISHETPAPAPDSWPHGWAELIAVLVLCLIAAGLRLAFPSRMAVEHFDEGVYASNLWCPDDGYRYPNRHLYAPSLLPALIEWLIIAFGTANWVPMLPSLVFGTLTIPLLWWVGRSWFHPVVGLSAATLAAFSDYHIAFSRSALTDVMLGFWLLLAVYLFERAFRSLSVPCAVAAGVVTGLAWWSKYNGWLPLAISLSGLAAWSLFTPRDDRHLGRRLMLWLITAATALLAWSPYWWSLPNGYGEVAANHRGYVVGLGGWVDSFTRQFLNLRLFDGRLTGLGVGIVASLVIYSAVGLRLPSNNSSQLEERTPETTIGPATLSLRMMYFVLVVGISFGFGILSVQGLGIALLLALMVMGPAFHFVPGLWSRWGLRRFETSEAACGFIRATRKEFIASLAQWLTFAWWTGLLVTTPLYRPFPRLVLPWLIAGWFLACMDWCMAIRLKDSARLSRVIGLLSADSDRVNRTQLHIFWSFTFLLMLLLTPPTWRQLKNPAWQSRSGLADIGVQVQQTARCEVARPGARNIGGRVCVLYVFAEPGLFFHLPADDLAIGPVGNLQFLAPDAKPLGLPTFLVTGPHADRMTEFHNEFAKYADRLELVQSWPYAASDFVLLDQVPPAELGAERAKLEVRLFRVK